MMSLHNAWCIMDICILMVSYQMSCSNRVSERWIILWASSPQGNKRQDSLLDTWTHTNVSIHRPIFIIYKHQHNRYTYGYVASHRSRACIIRAVFFSFILCSNKVLEKNEKHAHHLKSSNHKFIMKHYSHMMNERTIRACAASSGRSLL